MKMQLTNSIRSLQGALLIQQQALSCVLVLASAFMPSFAGNGQGVTPLDSAEAHRFTFVLRAAEKAGYKQGSVVAHGARSYDRFFAILATHAKEGVLALMSEQNGKTAGPVVLERAENPVQIGVRGVQFGSFLDLGDFTDVTVSHEPYMLETSHRFDTHHLVRLRGEGMAAVCEFAGNSVSSSSKGMRSMSNSRQVSFQRVRKSKAVVFTVRTIDETTETRPDRKDSTITSHTETVKKYELSASGACKELK